MHITVFESVVVRDAVNDRPGLERAGSAVQKDKRLSVHLLPKRRKIRPKLFTSGHNVGTCAD